MYYIALYCNTLSLAVLEIVVSVKLAVVVKVSVKVAVVCIISIISVSSKVYIKVH